MLYLDATLGYWHSEWSGTSHAVQHYKLVVVRQLRCRTSLQLLCVATHFLHKPLVFMMQTGVVVHLQNSGVRTT